MKFRLPGSFRGAEDFRARLGELGLSVALDDACEGGGPRPALEWALADASQPLRDPPHGGLGRDAGRLALRPHAAALAPFGRSGAALIQGGEAYAVQADGRANRTSCSSMTRRRPSTSWARCWKRLARAAARSAPRTTSDPSDCS